MLVAVGHEFMEDFFGSCENALEENGLFVLQVTIRLRIFGNYLRKINKIEQTSALSNYTFSLKMVDFSLYYFNFC